jgi:cytochrome c oxidase cbb3-type subunit 3
LTDAIWLYGGDKETLTETVTNARFGVMPAWAGRLSESDIRSVAVYVHGLGGGE